mmetsp:Transcript_7017/g.15091  ORF Transcript_7017/g.15091 Transcript_7017/m.15091 type:complete len:209 (+) Transcript_7017:804-1430(+)
MPQLELENTVLLSSYESEALGVELCQGIITDSLNLQHSDRVMILKRGRELQIPVYLLILRRPARQSRQLILSPRRGPIVVPVTKRATLGPVGKSSQVPHSAILRWPVQTGAVHTGSGNVARLSVVYGDGITTAVLSAPQILEVPVSHSCLQLNRRRYPTARAVGYHVPDSKGRQESHHIGCNGGVVLMQKRWMQETNKEVPGGPLLDR